jgi:hypothetical protein
MLLLGVVFAIRGPGIGWEVVEHETLLSAKASRGSLKLRSESASSEQQQATEALPERARWMEIWHLDV